MEILQWYLLLNLGCFILILKRPLGSCNYSTVSAGQQKPGSLCEAIRASHRRTSMKIRVRMVSTVTPSQQEGSANPWCRINTCINSHGQFQSSQELSFLRLQGNNASHLALFPKLQSFLSSGELHVCKAARLQWIPTSEAVTSVIPLATSHRHLRDRAGLPLVARAELWGSRCWSTLQGCCSCWALKAANIAGVTQCSANAST